MFNSKHAEEVTGLKKSSVSNYSKDLKLKKLAPAVARQFSLQDLVLMSIASDLQKLGYPKSLALEVAFAIEPTLPDIVETDSGSYFVATPSESPEVWKLIEIQSDQNGLDVIYKSHNAVVFGAAKLVRTALRKIVLLGKAPLGAA